MGKSNRFDAYSEYEDDSWESPDEDNDAAEENDDRLVSASWLDYELDDDDDDDGVPEWEDFD